MDERDTKIAQLVEDNHCIPELEAELARVRGINQRMRQFIEFVAERSPDGLQRTQAKGILAHGEKACPGKP